MAAITLRPYQLEAVESIFKYWHKTENKGNPVVVMPVGSGKTLTMSYLVRTCFDRYGNYMSKVLVVTHVKELIEQDYEGIVDYWPGAPVGIYSASLNKKQTDNRIICCGVQSIAKPETYKKFGKVNCIIIDECHLVPAKAETTYRRLISGLKEINPKLKVIGFTGTPFRLDCGWITENGIFDDIVYNMCTVEAFDWLIQNNFMCDAIPRRPEFQIDVSNVKIRGGEFVEKDLQQAVDTDAVTRAALNETIQLAKDSTVLIHESTFISKDSSNAEEHAHSTSTEAAYIAKESNCKELILTHISTRYGPEYGKIMLSEAQEIFENTKLANDFLEIKLQ